MLTHKAIVDSTWDSAIQPLLLKRFPTAMADIPARYATGYLADIGVPQVLSPMDFSAWFEVYLNDRWWALDARHNQPRIGRLLVAVGRDAADVAITTFFGQPNLTSFTVVTEEVTRV